MTARTLATLALALGLTALAGCSGGKDDTEDTDQAPTDGADEPTAETGDEGPDYFTPKHYISFAGFTYDVSTNSLIEVQNAEGDPVAPFISILIGTADWATAGFATTDPELFCFVTLPLNDASFPTWAQEAGLWYGLEYTGETPITNCNEAGGYNVDPEWSGGVDGGLATMFAERGTWGIGIGEVDQEFVKKIPGWESGYPYTNLPEGSLLGVTVVDPFFEETLTDVGIGYAIDATTTPPTIGEPLLANEIYAGAGVAVTTYFETFGLNIISFQ